MSGRADPALFDALEASWPAAERDVCDGLALRFDAAEAGSRVRSSRVIGCVEPAAAAARIEAFYGARGASPLHQAAIPDPEAVDRPVDAQGPVDPLTSRLAARGFRPFDPCLLMAGPASTAAALAPAAPGGPRLMTARIDGVAERFLASLSRLWREGGVGGERRAVMARALRGGAYGGALALRVGDRIAGAAFYAGVGSDAFVHALHVAEHGRRQGGARALLKQAAQDASAQGAKRLAVSVRISNAPARRLFAAAGLTPVGGYLYWRKER